MIFGFSHWDLPFKGGTMVPSVDLVFALQAGVPADLHLFLQAWIADPAGVKKMSASNALEVITP